MKPSRAVLVVLILTGGAISLSPQVASAQALAASRSQDNEDRASSVRDQFMRVLRQSAPPSLGTVWKADPTLITDQYLASYPAVVAFLNQHPEIRRNPTWYLQAYYSNSDGYYNDPRQRSWDNLMEMAGVFVIMLTIVGALGWLVRTAVDYRRWGRLAKVQADAHAKLLDRFTGNEELLGYVQSPAGRKFLQSSPISIDGATRPMAAPLSRILWSMQAGVVLSAAGLGMNYVSRHIDPDKADPVFTFSIILLSLGLGFIASSGMSYLMSRRLGLLNATPVPTDD